MDESGLIQKPKRQKLNEEQDIEKDIKILDNLPGEIVQYILSLLPTKDAARTSILSKSWENQWMCIPNLVFQQLCHGERTLFKNFVDRVLLLRDSDIEKFTLYFHVLHDAFLVNAWISAVVRHNVQELHVSLSDFEGSFSLSDCLLTCETLTHLNIDMPCILKLPATIYFLKLKILALRCVSFSDWHPTQKLFAGFPVLENLCLDECHWMNQMVVSISVPKLSWLTIHETERKRLTDLDGCQVTILGVSLIGFYYTGEFFNEYSLCNSSLLEEASIYACGFKKRPRQVVVNRNYKLLKGVSNAKEIMLSSYAVEALKYAAEFPRHMPMFKNLLNLELRRRSINLGSTALLKILQESPNLKTLEFSEVFSLSSDCEKDDSILDPVPPCLLSQLNCIRVCCYHGDEKELSAIKILLENALVLNKIVIYCSKHLAGDLEKQEKVFEQLLKHPRWSKTCEFVFELS